MAYYLYKHCEIPKPDNFEIISTTICEVSDLSNPDKIIIQNPKENPIYIYFGSLFTGEKSIFKYPSNEFRAVSIHNVRIVGDSIVFDLNVYEYVDGYIHLIAGYMVGDNILQTELLKYDKCIKYIFGNEPKDPKIDYAAKKPIIEYEVVEVNKNETEE